MHCDVAERSETIWVFSPSNYVAMWHVIGGQTASGFFQDDGTVLLHGWGGGYPNFSITGQATPSDNDHFTLKYTWQVPPEQGPQHPQSCTGVRAPEGRP